MQSRKPPFWQVEFEGWNRPTLYLSPSTGELISRRHTLWRVFDFVWMLHIMDYDERTDVNNPLLRIATWSAFAMAISGACLLIWSRSEEHTSELQSLMRISYAVFCLKKKKKNQLHYMPTHIPKPIHTT